MATRGVIRHQGRLMSYQDLGPVDAPVVLLIHGIMSDSTTWTRAAGLLADNGYRVLAPDLPGHGESDKVADGYQLADFAASLVTLLTELQATEVTVVGHSFGGAVAMQLAYDHPELVRRLVLVSAGGLGRRVHPVLRAATLPGAHNLVRMVVNSRTAALYSRPRLHRSLRLSPDVVTTLSRAGRGLSSPDGRTAFFQTVRGVISPFGQRGSLLELDYVQLELPTLIVWSERDPVLPVAHAYETHAHLRNSSLEVFPGASHQPHHHLARRFVQVLSNFIATT
ncbi:alpha/beta fold hydrolase [Jatrophihabitans sp.]|uniref:alpha/beta fold hydrolase n=1 Tax=Jatrophihabitans sp. TaxID=1932789 RepID=UPI002C12984F|nr:alpha/beta fold hydrolase [Jatrophihabitans sp.]